MPEPLTIAYLTSAYARAGDTYVRREVAELRRMGHVVPTFSVRKPEAKELVSEEIRREAATTTYLLRAGPARLALAGLRRALASPRAFFQAARLAGRAAPPGTERRWTRRAAYLLEASLLAEQLIARRARHLHNHIGENSAAVAMLASRLSGVPYSLTIHGPGEFDRPTLLALDLKIHHAAFVVAVSEFTRSQLYRWSAPENWSKIRVVHCGVDDEFAMAPAVPAPGRPRLVSVGRLDEQKGQLLLIEAAERLRARGLDFELVLVGDGPLRGALEERIERAGLRGRVQLAGYQDSRGVRAAIQAARALVLPSFAEGLPGVIFEAMALGRPVIGTYIAGTPELVEPGRNGWLVPAGALGPLVDAMEEAIKADPGELDRMGRAGRARVLERHNTATEVRKLLALIEGTSASGAIDNGARADDDDGAGAPRPAPAAAATTRG